MAKVSGVPYEVNLPNYSEHEVTQDMIATLEYENNCLRARNQRLEEELRVANDLLVKQNKELLNARVKSGNKT